MREFAGLVSLARHCACLNSSSSSGCVVGVACARAPAVLGVSASASSFASTPASFAVVARARSMHDAHNSWSDTGRVQGTRGRRCTKCGVSSPAEDLLPVSEVEAGVNFRPAGCVREQVASSLPRKQPGTGTRQVKGSVVTPSLHPEVPGIQFVSPGYGLDIRQSMGRVAPFSSPRCGKKDVPTGVNLNRYSGSGSYRLPGLRQGTTVCVHTSMDIGMSIWPLLIPRVLVLLLMSPVGLLGREVRVRVGISLLAVPTLWLLLSLAMSLIGGWFTPHFSVLARFRIGAWMADVACPIVSQPLWPACWLDTPDRSSSSSTRVVQDVWDVYRDELGVVPADAVLALRSTVSRSSVDDFWSIWSKNAEAGLFRAYSKAGGPSGAGGAAFFWQRPATYSLQASGM